MKKAIILVAVLFLSAAVPLRSDTCDTSAGTSVAYFDSCNCNACAYVGPGCTYCCNSSDTCYTDGASCKPAGGHPDNQYEDDCTWIDFGTVYLCG